MKRGFTIIEILVILAIIALLVTIVLVFLNPIEMSKRNRDLQRVKDLQALSLAINNYLTSATQIDLDGPFYDLSGWDEENPSIYISLPSELNFTFSTITDYYGREWRIIQNSPSTNLYNNNGEGWLPINFSENNISLPMLPVDPLNNIDVNNSNKNYFYSYVFRRETNEFELNAKFESKSFAKQAEDDGGSDKEIFEIGNNKCLIAFGSSSALYGTTTITECSSAKLDTGLLVGNITGGDICWNKLFDYYPTTNYIYRNNIGDYLVIGNNFLSSPTTSIYLSFFDKFGNFKFTKAIYFNTATPMNFNYVHQTKNGDYILALSLNGSTIQASLVMKLNNSLTPQWIKYYCHLPSNCTAKEESIYVVDDINGNINLVRNTGNFAGFQIINVSSSNGDILGGGDYYYQITFGRLYAGNRTNDSGFVLLGTEGVATSPPAFLAKLDSQNNFEWIKKYNSLGMSSHYQINSPRQIFVFQTNDGGYLFNAMYDIDLNATSYIFAKVDYQGRLEWIKKYNGDWSKINVRKIFQDKQDNYWLVVNSSSENYLIKLDSSFNKISEYKITPYASNDNLIFNNFYQLFDNSYLLVGNFVDSSDFLVWFFKDSWAKGGQLEEIQLEEISLPKSKYYFNPIKFISEKNLFYLKNNLYNITSTNLFSFSDSSSTVTDITIGTLSYTINSYALSFTQKLIQPKETILVNQCDNYFSKSVVKGRVIEKLIKAQNNYLAVGRDLTTNVSSFWIAKFSTSGDIVSSSTIKISDENSHQFNSVIQDGNNFVAVGKYYQEGNPDSSWGYIAKFNNSLVLINSSSLSFGSELNDVNNDNSYYIGVGRDLSSEPKALLVKFNSSSLAIVASSTYSEKSEFNTILVDKDKNYLVGGQINNQAYLVKINSTTLATEWQKKYYLKLGNERIVKIIFDQDNNIITLSNLFDSQDNKFKLVLRKINPADGEVIKEKLISDNYFYGRDIILDYNNDFLITGFLPLKQDGNNFSDWSLGLAKITQDFNLVWQKYYGGQSRKELSFGASIVEAFDAGYLIGGYNGANNNVWLLKVSYLGDCLGCLKIGYFDNFFKLIKKNIANFLNLILR